MDPTGLRWNVVAYSGWRWRIEDAIFRRMKRDDLVLRGMLESGHNKKLTLEIAAWVGCDRRRFAELLGAVAGPDGKLAQRAAWVLGGIGEMEPALVEPHVKELLDLLERPGLHPAIPRNVLRLLGFVRIPGDCEGRVLTAAMAALGGAVPVAVKVYAMTVIKRVAAGYPEILAEVRLLVEEQWHESGPAFRSRARREFGIGDAGPW